MAVNVKLGTNVISGINYVKLENSDKTGQYYTFLIPDGSYSATANGEYDVSAYKTVAVSIPEYDGTVE